MAITIQGTGAFSSGTTSCTPGYPTGVAAGDLVLLGWGNKPYTAAPSIPSGFSSNGQTLSNGGAVANGTGVGSARTGWMYREATGALSGTITMSAVSTSPLWGQMQRLTKDASEAWSLIGYSTGDADATNTTVATVHDNTFSPHTNGDFATGDAVCVFVAVGDDVPTHSSQAIVIPGCTVGTVTWARTATTQGNDACVWIGTAMITAGSSTAGPTYTATASASGVGSHPAAAFIRVRATGGGGGAAVPPTLVMHPMGSR